MTRMGREKNQSNDWIEEVWRYFTGLMTTTTSATPTTIVKATVRRANKSAADKDNLSTNDTDPLAVRNVRLLLMAEHVSDTAKVAQ